MAPVLGRHGNNPCLSKQLRSVQVLTSNWNRDGREEWNGDRQKFETLDLPQHGMGMSQEV